MKKLIFGLGLLGLSLLSHAGDKGNGGDGLVMGKKVYLLDLVEAGVEERPVFDYDLPIDEGILRKVRAVLPVSADVQELVARKLTEISKISPVTAISLRRAMEAYSFRFVAPELVDVPDEGTGIQHGQHELVQLAIRSDRSILISRTMWAKLESTHKAALIFHELVYASSQIIAETKTSSYQSSPFSRQLVGFLFSQDLEARGIYGLRIMTRGGKMLPVSDLPVLETSHGVCLNPGIVLKADYGFEAGSRLPFPRTDEATATVADQLCASQVDVLKATKGCEQEGGFRSKGCYQLGETTMVKDMPIELSCDAGVAFNFIDYDEAPAEGDRGSRPTRKSAFSHAATWQTFSTVASSGIIVKATKTELKKKKVQYGVDVVSSATCGDNVEGELKKFLKGF